MQSTVLDTSEGPNTLDIDVDEIKDRVDLLKETVDQLANDKQELEYIKIAISSFCIERAKI